jgi:uncharacterized protein (DUF58 family)
MNFGTRSYADASGKGQTKSADDRTYWSKFDHATALAAAVSYVTLRQGDRVGLVTFADSIQHQVKRSSAQGTWRQIVGALGTHTVDRPTDMGRVVDEALAKIGNRCLIVMISDFFEDSEAVRAAIARIRHRRHDLIAFQVLDEAETSFDFDETAPFEGLEGEPRLRVDPRSIRKAYLEAIGEHIEKIERTMLKFGFDYQRLGTHDWLGPPLAKFVARRNAQIKRSKYG